MESLLDPRALSDSPDSGAAAVRIMADSGDPEAQFSLGLRYSHAPGNALDYPQAARYYQKAADQGHALAQYNLGVMFTHGQGVPKDIPTAEGWIRKAAEGGDAGGQYDLGVICHRASVDPLRMGNTESRIEAFKWYRLAAAQEYKDAVTAWQQICLTMTRGEVTEGNRRVDEFVARQPAPSIPPAPPTAAPPERQETPAPANPAPTAASPEHVKMARILETDDGEFSLEYENGRAQKQSMRLDALTYEGALREARSYLEIQADDRDPDGDRWNLE